MAASGLATGCQKRPARVPGETDILIQKAEILPAEGQDKLHVNTEPLMDRLGMRPGSLILTPRTYSEFREAEDRRRIEAFFQQLGYFDVVVSLPETEFSPDRSKVSLTFRVKENDRYKIGEVHLAGPPGDEKDWLVRAIPFSTGEQDVDLEKFRRVRNDMAEHLRRDGYGHANVYSRAYVDRNEKLIHWFYFVDAGPRTTIASIQVDGNVKVPAEKILERSGMKVGDPYKEGLRDTVPVDLLDTGSFSSAFVRVDTKTKFVPPGTAPDTGGELSEEQVDKNGNLVPRKLPTGVNVIVHVVEAPSRSLRVRGGFEIDPARADATLGATVWLRNLFAPFHHLVLEGRAGYGLLFQQSPGQPQGVYGDALIRSTHPGVFGRIGDLRLSARARTELFPGAYLTELSAGPGVRSTLLPRVFFDLDLLAVYGKANGFTGFSAADRARLALPDKDESINPELSATIRWDARDNPIEAKSGHYLGFAARFSPGAPIGTHRYLNLAPEARGFLPLTASISLGGRVSAEWSLLHDDAGVPLGARLFGGGAYGFRGVGRQQLSPLASTCFAGPVGGDVCSQRFVGGLSLFEASAELRFLSFQKQYGAVVFTDFGGAGAGANPFEDGLSFAAGIGARLRLWYLPISVDVAYRALSRGEPQGFDKNPVSAFARIGEAF
jgi:outer membrane translocation and assembly module TamA